MKSNILLFSFLLVISFACNTSEDKKRVSSETALASSEPVRKKVSHLEPALFQADSLQVLYYDNPNSDSLRYSRFFTYTETNLSASVDALLKELDQNYEQHNQSKSCRSEGKLYLLKGEDILKTIYFSTRGDSCTYFYFIKDGSFVYFPLTATAANWLKANKQKAQKPVLNKSADL